jgi:hypothetical protein
VQIKAQGIINACNWVKEEFGIQTLERILDECSPSVRIRCSTAIAINWHPVQEFIEFLERAEFVLGSQDGHVAEWIGEAGARANLKGALMRMAFWLSNPDFMMRRIAGLWQQFNDEGEMKLLHAEDTLRRIEVTGVARPNWLFCCTITGWARVTTETVGVPSPIAKHVECRARGDERCIWDVTSPPR